MPEQLTKHPQVTLQVLQSAGAQCGVGVRQEILTACPPARFCKLPGGEICVYGLPEAPQMTQIGTAEWQALAARLLPSAAAPADAGALPGAVIAAAAVGVVIGALIVRLRRR